MAKKARPRQPKDVVTTALDLAVRRGWRNVSLNDIAAAANVSLAELHGSYRSRAAIVAAFWRRIDEAVLAAGNAEGDAARDRLFDVLMRRFDAMAPHKAGVTAVLHDAGRDPVASLCGVRRLCASMTWMLEAAGIRSAGPGFAAQATGLAAVYLSTLRVWLGDDSADMARTMKALDMGLRRAERLVRLCDCLPRRGLRGQKATAEA